MTEKENLIYLAGFIDGEGCLTTSFDYPINRIRPRLTITNTNKEVLEWIHAVFGGSLYLHKPRGSQTRASYELMFFCNKAMNLIEKVYPFLKVKKKEADVFLRFRETVKNRELGKSLQDELSSLKH